MPRAYRYVGSEDIAITRGTPPYRVCIRSAADVQEWLAETRQPAAGEVVATFIVALEGHLWIADRHSEHVHCARGQPVLAAGEMTFRVSRTGVEVTAVSNQSTGFCPELESWPVVAAALECAALPHPGQFTTQFVFRRCEACGTANVVKDGWFECAVCQGPLPEAWDF